MDFGYSEQVTTLASVVKKKPPYHSSILFRYVLDWECFVPVGIVPLYLGSTNLTPDLG